MGLCKEERCKRVLRGFKTIFFLIYMFISLMLFSAPLLLIVADALLPSALLSASLPPSSLSAHFTNYDFRYSLIDIPLISLVRSAIILCVYSLCDGPRLSRGPYLGIATICSVSSLVFVSLKASYVFNTSNNNGGSGSGSEMALFVCSWVLAIGHIVVAYRTSCRETRKMLVYKIDIEAVTEASFWLTKLVRCINDFDFDPPTGYPWARMGFPDIKRFSKMKEVKLNYKTDSQFNATTPVFQLTLQVFQRRSVPQ